jgi:polyhydroxyalkanoate synthesis regulator phasin
VVPAEAVRDDAPATVGELRSLRRWLAVAGIWAVAASAIAIIALLAANDDDDRRPGGVTNSQLTGVQRDLDERIDSLERQVEELPTSEDTQKLENRLKTAEERAGGARSDARAVRGDLDELQQQVDDLEQQQQNDAGGTGGASPETETTP